MAKQGADAEVLARAPAIADAGDKADVFMTLAEADLAANRPEAAAEALAAAGTLPKGDDLTRLQLLTVKVALARQQPDAAVATALALTDPLAKIQALSLLAAYGYNHPQAWSAETQAKLTKTAHDLTGTPDLMTPGSLPEPFPPDEG